jgi:anti-sigma regulatory factor (Ser/Thr protein kinase)
MKELALHILDLVKNSVNAEATAVQISIIENTETNKLKIKIADNGNGMLPEMISKVEDPFFTTGNKKTGLGIPLMKQQAEATEGKFEIISIPGKGTTVKALFTHNHIDRQPMGDIAATITSLIRSYPEIEFIYKHSYNKKQFVLDTCEMKVELNGIPINKKEIIDFIKDMIDENLREITNLNGYK